ncbi:beta strand repeat-containing protein [Bythopirellula goksoeyrii]|uniref:Lipoprotein n=1 Tax=Bythopirellula goksoeyrii TaxID=1400387 RepID=A0A5B9QSA0_9BACT|nr:hypothetical protein [Bythopirellula goksoeyrii]QEG37001.1 hypothetical protein Pr1d_43410 [Bythopirellula goksoeyrii]
MSSMLRKLYVGLFRGLLICSTSLLPTAPGMAITTEWTGSDGNGGSGTFQNSSHWDAGVPDVGDRAQFFENAIPVVVFTGDAVSDELTVTDGTVFFESDSSTLRTYTLATGPADANISGGTLQIGTALKPVFLNLPNVSSDGGLNVSVMNIGSQADGTVSVVGVDSRLDVLGATNHSLGFSGNHGVLIVSDNALANFGTVGSGGTLNLADSGNGGSQATVLVDTGGILNVGNLDIATLTSNATGTLIIDGSLSSVNQTLSGANLTVGSASGGMGTIRIENGASFTTGTGTTTINATGTVNVGIVGDGAFDVRGPVNINAGSLNVGDFDDFQFANGQTLIASNNAQLNFGRYLLGYGSTFEINSGSDFMVAGDLGMGLLGEGTLTARESGSNVSVTGALQLGLGSNTATATFGDDSNGTFEEIALADTSTSGAVGTLSVESGAHIDTGLIAIATKGGDALGTLNVENATVIQDSGSLTIGSATGSGTGTLNIRTGAQFETQVGVTTINSTGLLNQTGGEFIAFGGVDVNGGSIEVSGGLFDVGVGTNLTATNNAQLNFAEGPLIRRGSTFEISTGSDLSVTGAFTMGFGDSATDTLIVDGSGSTFAAGSGTHWGDQAGSALVTLRNNAFGIFSGTLEIGSNDLSTAGQLDIEMGAVVTAEALTIRETGTVNVGLTGDGTLNTNGPVLVDGGILNVSSIFYFDLADGQTLTASNSAQLDFGSYQIDDGTRFEINSGSDWLLDTLQIGIGENGMLIVEGPGSTVTTTSASFARWGFLGNANITFRNEASGDFGDIRLADSSDSVSSLSIESNADLVLNDLDIATSNGGKGTLTIIGSGSTLTQTGDSTLNLGNESETGSATINIVNGGVYTTGTGTTTINGTGTLNIGNAGVGSFNANEDVVVVGGRINKFTSGNLNLAAGKSVTASEDAVLNFLGQYIVNSGNRFEITSGADFRMAGLFVIGTVTDGELIIDGPGSELIVANHAYWGLNGGSAIVTLRNNATAQVDGSLVLGSSDVGLSSGIFRIQSGGQYNNTSGDTVIDATGQLSIAGGTLNAKTIDHTNGGLFIFVGGTLSVGTFHGDLTNIGGILAPGSSAGGTTIVGDYTQQTGAALEIEIGGTLQVAEFDFVNVTGTTLLDGDLQLALLNGFVPDPSDSFTILSTSVLAGFFDNVASGGRLSTIDGLGSFEVTLDFSADQIVLSDFESSLSADVDLDGDVDGADFLMIQRTNPALISQWQTQHGMSQSTTVTAAVPEPSTLLVLTLVFLANCCRRNYSLA